MTEDEARQKWCPFARYVPARKFSFGRIKAAVNRWLDADDTQLNPEPARCIGSSCMAWRWSGKDTEKKQDYIQMFPGEFSDTDGYCGLASRL